MAKGIAFWRKDENSGYIHLRFAISEPDVDNKVLVVGMTTWHGTGREDQSCILMPNDHECIKAKSYISYENAFEIDYGSLLKEKFEGKLILRNDISDPVLKKIQEGAKKSPALPLKFKKYFDLF